jgi:putative endonuclease
VADGLREMYVYILRSKKNSRFYTGLAKNVNLRLQQHNRGENKATKGYRPWILVRVEEYKNKTLAMQREKFLKTGRGREVIRNLCLL